MPSIDIEDSREQVNRLRASLKRELDSINDNASFSDQGRRMESAKARLRHRKEAESMRETFASAVNARRSELTRRLFGVPTGGDAASYRDATDRVYALRSPADLSVMLERAVRTGDNVLVRAIGARAIADGMGGLLETLRRSAPNDVSGIDLDELRGLPSHGTINAAFHVPGVSPDLSLSERLEVEQEVEAS